MGSQNGGLYSDVVVSSGLTVYTFPIRMLKVRV